MTKFCCKIDMEITMYDTSERVMACERVMGSDKSLVPGRGTDRKKPTGNNLS